ATIVKFRLWAMAMIDSVMATALLSSGRFMTNDRSIFSSCSDIFRRYASDENPVPKSSSDSLSPMPPNTLRVARVCCMSRMTMLSVSSRQRQEGSMPVLSSTLATISESFPELNWHAETLTESLRAGMPADRHATYWLQAV